MGRRADGHEGVGVVSRWGGRKAQGLTRLTVATYGTRCHLCGRDGATTADHVVPRSLGGTDELTNLRPAHSSCNYKRQDMPLHIWRERYPMNAQAIQSRSPRWLSSKKSLDEPPGGDGASR